MARTLPGGGGERTLLAGAHLNIYQKLEIKDSDGAWRDLTNLSGFDWLDRWTVEENIDDPVARGTFVLRREIGALSLAPLVQASALNKNGALAYVPLLTAPRLVRFSVAEVANGVTPIAGDYHEIFQGPIVEVDAAEPEDGITVKAFDLGSLLQIVQIETEEAQGSFAGTAVQTVMQNIINRWVTVAPPTLVTPVSPGWLVTTFMVPKANVLQALRDLALQIGWDLRFMYQAATNTPELRLYQPPRGVVVPDWSFADTEYLRLPRAPLSDDTIRNVAKINYIDVATALPASRTRTNAGSIAIYGRRFMEITEEATSNIDTAGEADTMGDAAVSDLGTPPQEHEIETLLFWPIQLNDLCRFLANGVQYDQDQDLAVIGFRHEGVSGDARTTLQCRGKPCGAFSDWIANSKSGSGGVDSGPAAPLPPSALITFKARNSAAEVVTLSGAAGSPVNDPVTWRTKLGNAAWSAVQTSALPQDKTVVILPTYAQQLILEVAQADGQAKQFSYTVNGRTDDTSSLGREDHRRGGFGGVPVGAAYFGYHPVYNRAGDIPLIDTLTGQLLAGLSGPTGVPVLTMEDGGNKASTGFTNTTGALVSTSMDSTGRQVRRAFAKALFSDPDILDSVADGTTYKHVLATAVTANQIDFSKAGVINRIAANVKRSAINATLLDTIVANITDTGDAGANMKAPDGEFPIESTRGSKRTGTRQGTTATSTHREDRRRAGEGGVPVVGATFANIPMVNTVGDQVLIDPATQVIQPGLAIGPNVKGDATVAFGSTVKYPTNRHNEINASATDGTAATFGVSYENIPEVRVLPTIVKLPGTSSTSDRQLEFRAVSVSVSGYTPRAVMSTGASVAAQSENPSTTINGTTASTQTITSATGKIYWNLSGANATSTTYSATFDVDTTSAVSGQWTVKLWKNTGTADDVSWSLVDSATFDANVVVNGVVLQWTGAMAANWDFKLTVSKTGGAAPFQCTVTGHALTYDKVTAGSETSMCPSSSGYALLVQALEKS